MSGATSRTPRAAAVRPRRRAPGDPEGPSRADVRAGRWVRTSRGLYVPRGVDRTAPVQRILEAGAVLPDSPSAAVTGWAALRWLGAEWLDGLAPGGVLVEVDLVTTVRDIRPRPGVRLSAERLDPAEVVVVDGLPVTVAARSVCFVLRHAVDDRAAVEVGETALHAGLCSLAEVTAYASMLPGWTGIPRARERLALMAEGSASPGETAMRLIWELDAGLGRPLRNVPVFTRDARHVATVDLLDPVAGLVGEYDGRDHLRLDRRRRDLRRESELRSLGLEYVTMVAGDRHRRQAMAQRILDAHRRARRVPPADRPWTLEQPEWWKRREAQRRARRTA